MNWTEDHTIGAVVLGAVGLAVVCLLAYRRDAAAVAPVANALGLATPPAKSSAGMHATLHVQGTLYAHGDGTESIATFAAGTPVKLEDPTDTVLGAARLFRVRKLLDADHLDTGPNTRGYLYLTQSELVMT